MDEILNLVVFHDDNENDDDIDDALVLHILNDNENLGNRAALYGRFDLEGMLNLECESLYRFSKDHIRRLTRALNLPAVIEIDNVTNISGVDGLCILLRRLAYPNRLSDLELLFGFSATIISHVANTVLDMIDNNKGHLLDDLGNVPFLNYNKLVQYSQAIQQKGCPLDNCWGFIDGTARPICRPGIDQEQYYSGHKKTHCVKFPSVICPDGIIVSLKGVFQEEDMMRAYFENRVFMENWNNMLCFQTVDFAYMVIRFMV